MTAPNRYAPPALHMAWAARAALCVATDDQAAMALLLEQVSVHEFGVNELVTAQAALLCDVLEGAGALGNLAAWAEHMQAAANDE